MRFFLKLLVVVLLLASCGSAAKFRLVKRPMTQQPATAWPTIGAFQKAENARSEHAIVVGVADYAFLPDIDGVAQTVNDWERYFKSRGATVDLVFDRDATKENVLERVRARPKSELVWFVFVGHGAPGADGKDGVMVGMDAQQNFNSIEARGVSRAALLHELKDQRAVLILDTCFSGRDQTGALLAQGTQPVIPVFESSEQPTITVLTASDADQFSGSLPNLDRPAFSYLVLGALQGWSGQETVSAKSVVAYASQLLRETPGRVQTPTTSGADFTFGQPPSQKTDLVSVLRSNVNTTEDAKTETVYIDTGRGLWFERPDPRWTLPGYVMSGAFYPKAVIHFRWGYDILILQTDGLFGRRSLGQAVVEFTHEPSPRTIGPWSGHYAEWVAKSDTDTQYNVSFSLLHADVVWRVTAITSSEERLGQLRTDVEDLVRTIEFPE